MSGNSFETVLQNNFENKYTGQFWLRTRAASEVRMTVDVIAERKFLVLFPQFRLGQEIKDEICMREKTQIQY